MSRKIEDLSPDFQDIARAIMRELAGQPIMLFMTRRTTAEQIAFYAQGREDLERVNALRLLAGMPKIGARENKYTVTNCDGVNIQSAHQSGRAIDIVAIDARGNPSWDYVKYANVYKMIREAGIKCGADCGGAWMMQSNGKPSPYASIGLGWDPPHIQAKY